MDIHPVLTFFNKVNEAQDIPELEQIAREVQSAVLSKILTDNKDIMILNLAIRMQTNSFLIIEEQSKEPNTKIVVIGNIDDFDPEEMQLKEMMDEERADLQGNVRLVEELKPEDK